MIDVEPQTALRPAAGAPKAQPPLQLEFTGRAGEYFRIWIVNLFLSIITIGIYSAWAKVRRRRYFYGHTWLAGSNFDYHGDPRAILRGRLIAVLFFAAYTLVGQYSHRLAAALALAALPLAPWVLVRSFRFNAVSTSYRNLRFGFDGRYGQVLVAILPVVIFPLATVVFGAYDANGARQPTPAELAGIFVPLAVFTLLYPWMSGRLHLLRVNGSRFGATHFRCIATVPQFYGLYVIAMLVGIGLALLTFGPAGVAAALLPRRLAWLLIVFIPIAYVAFLSCLIGYTQSRVANLVYNDTSLGEGVRLRSTLKARSLARVYITNLLAVVCTLGFALPWAAIRLARVRAAALAVEAPEGLDHVLAGNTPEVGATGEEVGELFAFDVAL